MSPTLAADPTAAIAAYLTAQIGQLLSVTPTTGDAPPGYQGPYGVPAMFRPELPRGFDELMPTECVVIRPSGGYNLFGSGQLPVADPRLDVLCFAGVALEAQMIARNAAMALKALAPTSQYESTMLKWAKVTGGPLPLVDPNTLWPCCLVVCKVMHAEAALP